MGNWNFSNELTVLHGDTGAVLRARAWDGGLTGAQLMALFDEAERVQRRLKRTFEKHPDWPQWRAIGEEHFEWMLARARGGHFALFGLRDHQLVDTQLRHPAGLIFRDMINFLYRRAYPVVVGGLVAETTSPDELYGFLNERADAIRALARTVLSACSEPEDDWHQAATCAVLLAPHLLRWTVVPQVGLAPPPAGQGNLERAPFIAVGASSDAERMGLTARRHMQGLLGHERRREQPGPHRGSRNRVSAQRAAFETYVGNRSVGGVSVQMITQDAEANRLYRATFGDYSDRELKEHTVRKVLKKQRNPTETR